MTKEMILELVNKDFRVEYFYNRGTNPVANQIKNNLSVYIRTKIKKTNGGFNMTKKEFYEKINGKKVVIENIEQIRKDIKEDYKDYKEQVKNYNLYMKTVGNKDITIKFNKEYGAGYQIGSQFIRTPLIQLILVHSIGTKAVVRSEDIIINDCHFRKKDIVILSDNTFTSVNKIAPYDIVFKIVD